MVASWAKLRPFKGSSTIQQQIVAGFIRGCKSFFAGSFTCRFDVCACDIRSRRIENCTEHLGGCRLGKGATDDDRCSENKSQQGKVSS